MNTNYAHLAQTGGKPVLEDYGVPGQDVFARITVEDFAAFHEQASEDAVAARAALDETDRDESRRRWRELLGPKFPKPDNNGTSGNSGGFNDRQKQTRPDRRRFA